MSKTTIQLAKPVIEKISGFEATIASLIAEKKALGMKHAQRPAKRAIDVRIQEIKDLNIKPLAAELAVIRFNCPTRAKFVNFVKDLAKNTRCWSFISLNPYENKYGEIARHTLNINFDYAEMKSDDKTTALDNHNDLFIEKMMNKYPKFTEENFRDGYKKILNPPQKDSDKVSPYETIVRGIKYHIYTGKLYICGLKESKVIMRDGVYPTVNSRPETICKSLIEKELGLLPSKYKIFDFNFVNSFNFNKDTLLIEPI